MTVLATALLLTVGTPTTAAALWSETEQTWRAAPRLHVEADVRAEGHLTADLKADLRLAPKGRARLEAKGRILGDRAHVWLVSDGRTLRWGASLPEPSPRFLQDGLTVAWLRLGLLYHLLEVGTGRPPEGIRADPSHWVTVADLRFTRAERPDCRSVAYRILVGGTEVGSARVCIDPETLQPRQRWSRVRFEGRWLTVTERYPRVEAPKRLDEAPFHTYPGGP